METLQKIDEYFFRLINSAGWEQMDEVMILISSKWFWIPLYIYILYLIYKRFSNQFPKIFKISPAYPNPFNPIINIQYENPQLSMVKVDVYDLRGRWIENIVNTVQSPGMYELKWNAGSHSSGIYLLRYQILTGETKEHLGAKAEKIVLLK